MSTRILNYAIVKMIEDIGDIEAKEEDQVDFHSYRKSKLRTLNQHKQRRLCKQQNARSQPRFQHTSLPAPKR
ncbi:hypothetical protein G4B88_000591 [Cannabis sativa]|uniref:Uncharacterized protein n=1 Tax=Cannabis sativa TaxID=3483 RepID=A0A7J6DZG6_CANSA|nr:hypothetical protein G4B88_000591 [Cannabis sativa]